VNYREYLRDLPRIVFFTGKGGVGKTSIACGTGAALAVQGKRVLLVSTDPASNLDEVLGVRLSAQPALVPGIERLSALNIDPAAAANAYREDVVRPFRGVLPEASIASIEEQLSGACTVEIAAFKEFTKLLADTHATAAFDYILFDTAPTGHTLRLLKLPGAWSGFLETNTTGTSCLGPLAGLQAQQSLYEASLRNLANPLLTRVVLVCRPEPLTLTEAERAYIELKSIGVENQTLVVNGIFTAIDRTDRIALSLEELSRHALSQIPSKLSLLPRLDIPFLSYAPLGVESIKKMFVEEDIDLSVPPSHNNYIVDGASSLATLIDEIESLGPGVILTMGKGGVGKTTVAAAIGVALAQRGHTVHLTTTDPAAHVAAMVPREVLHLRMSRIDPKVETQKYSAQIREQAAPFLDPSGRDLLEEDLRSPCTEEIAVFRAFAETVAGGENEFVVVDTAPTGHTILLLDAAETYHREVSRSTGEIPEAVRELIPRLRDGRFTRIILVTLPEATPVHEAAKLQEDLERAGITPFAWVVNQSFAACDVKDSILKRRCNREFPYIAEVRDRLSRRLAILPWNFIEPTGGDQLVGTPLKDSIAKFKEWRLDW
jgi:arsenite-transporting ATPase